jgi:hypothetical protein
VALQKEKNRLSLKDNERPLLGYDVVQHTAGCSAVQDEAGRVRAGVPLNLCCPRKMKGHADKEMY